MGSNSEVYGRSGWSETPVQFTPRGALEPIPVIENIPRKVQVYPYTWDVFLDDVFLDGVRLPRSQLSTPDIQLSALIDTVRFIYLYP